MSRATAPGKGNPSPGTAVLLPNGACPPHATRRESTHPCHTAGLRRGRQPGYGRPMARKNRIQFHGASYHVGNRGVARAAVFHSEEDRHQFIATLAGVVEEHG